MKRTTIFLDDSLTRKAFRYAEKHGVSFASVVREALAQFLSAPGRTKTKLPSIAGQYASAPAFQGSIAERAEELLWDNSGD